MDFDAWMASIERLLQSTHSTVKLACYDRGQLEDDWKAGASPLAAQRKLLTGGYQLAQTQGSPATNRRLLGGQGGVPPVDPEWLKMLHDIFSRVAWLIWIIGAVAIAGWAFSVVYGARNVVGEPGPVIAVVAVTVLGGLLSATLVAGIGATWMFLAHFIRWMDARDRPSGN